MLGYVCLFYLIRIVVFFNRYRSLDCCTVLSGKVFLQFLLLWRISLFFPLFFYSLWSDLFYNMDVCTFPWMLTLFDTLFYIVFVHRVVITVPFIQSSDSQLSTKDEALLCESSVLQCSPLYKSRQGFFFFDVLLTVHLTSCLYMFRAHVLETCRGMKWNLSWNKFWASNWLNTEIKKGYFVCLQ